ncbi:putative Zn-binding protein involved in type VI secretion [Paraburkholderia fungorum]|uniref:Zn-binding protein involved in type VI secretion n=1 Tax=Paraburkholderia fungorum TaxID=134537 RepID=A0AAW3V273_9BURK|nr:putative Zn-binding protein involved in type VI secretion [Paraburkholderia fungorum]MBB6203880.1 putative Zn-binding protein involved in type VI secretion [Paraburkholderia fungorum]
MMNLIRLGDDTDHDGKVITASSTMQFEGGFVARKGDAFHVRSMTSNST